MESPPVDEATAQQHRAERVSCDRVVTVHLDAQSVVGSGENVSASGVFFIADGSIEVSVEIEGEPAQRGQLVRVQSMSDGRVGIAVRFAD